MQFEQLIREPKALPTVPEVISELIATLDMPECETADIARLIASDPVLAAKLLKLANTSFFWRGRTVGNIDDGLRVLGLSKVRALAIGMALSDSFPAIPKSTLEQFWNYSLNSAELSRIIAVAAKADDATAFTAGLIHGIGELVMWVGMPEAMDQLDRVVKPLDVRRHEAEESIFGYSYERVGGELARRWRFPWKMVNAVEHHLSPLDNSEYEPIACVVHIAAWRARTIELGWSQTVLITNYPDHVSELLGVDPEIVLNYASPAEQN